MIRNYLKIAFRNLFKHKVLSLANVVSLTIGFASCGLIALYIFDEWQVDKLHQNGERLYRVITTNITKEGTHEILASSVGRPLAKAIERDVPEVEKVVALHPTNMAIKHQNKYFYEKQAFVGATFFEMFSFPLVSGNAQTALKEPYTVVISERLAQKFFGNAEALGQTLTILDTLTFKVTGVMATSPPSHLGFEMYLSLSTFYALGRRPDTWFTWDEYCYLMLHKNADFKAAQSKVSALSMKYNRDEYKNNGMNVAHQLEAVPSIHLYSEAGNFKPLGSAKQLWVLGIIGIFILLLACINFVNLSTASQSNRAKEVGIKKVIGATQKALIGQFVGESLLMALVAGGFSVVLMLIGLPFLNQLTDKTIPLSMIFKPTGLLAGLAFLSLTGLLAGWYPAVLIARFQPLATLKNTFFGQSKGQWLSKSLVVVQFCIATMLIIGTIVALNQVKFMQGQQLGFDKERVVVINLQKTPQDFGSNYENIKQQLGALPNVQSVSGMAAVPGRDGWGGQLVWVAGRPQAEAVSVEVITTDHDYVKTLGLTLKHGRDYSKKMTTDAQSGVLLNEAAAKHLGWTPAEAVGKKLSTAGMENGIVLGVVGDFHQHSLKRKINPLLYFIYPDAYSYVAVKLGKGDISSSISAIEKFWNNRFTGYELEYSFLDDEFDKQYKAEQKTYTIFTVFAVLAILIACLGVFALITHTAQQRTKEIGIRKVLGASVVSIMALLSKDFLKLVLVAIVIASPIAYYFMDKWLADFAYRIQISWWIFAAAGALAVLIAFLTVGYQSVKAALMNPVKSLKTE